MKFCIEEPTTNCRVNNEIIIIIYIIMLKILLADDHAIIRSALKILIQNHIGHTEMDVAFDGNSVLEKVRANEYDLIVLDVNMPDTDAVDLVTEIINLKPDSRLLMFSMNAEEIFAKRFLQLGAMGYLSKTAIETEIIKAIQNVLNNKKYLSAIMLERLTQQEFKDKNRSPFACLSRRESQIAFHILKERTISEISEMLHLHPSTVGTFKSRIFEKLNCTTVMEMVSLARLYKVE